MKKTYKMYEAPEAEMIEMQMPVVLTGSAIGGQDSNTGVGGNPITGGQTEDM